MAKMTQISSRKYAFFETAIGRCSIAWNDVGIVALRLPYSNEAKMRSHLRRRFGALEEVEPPPHIHRAIDAVASVMNGEKVDLSDLVLDVRDVPEFNRRVYDIARAILPGSTLT